MCPASYLRNMLKLKSWFVHVKRINFNLIQLNPIPRQLSITSPSSGSTEAANAKDIKEPIKEPKIENKYACNHPGLMEFFEEPKNWGEEEVKSGRPWRLDELRIKSNSDLHKLWYVLLKERNMLLTMEEAANREKELFPSPERIDKVEESMEKIETVVKERNKAYWELEVAEGEDGCRKVAFRRDRFGRHRRITCSEHVIPYWMNTKWRQLNGPGYGADVEQFLRQLNEKKVRMKRTLLFKQAAEVRQLIRRFPDMDLDYLQEQNPKLGVKYLKENLDKYTERYVINKTYGRRFKHITPSNL